MRIAGASSTSAPSSERIADSSEACSRVRVTRTRTPDSGRVSQPPSTSRSDTTSPTTVIAGGRIFARAAADAIRDSGAVTVRIVGSVASWITAVGVDAGLPASISARATPMRPS